MAVLLNAAILSAVLWEQVPPVASIAWLCAVTAVSLYRWIIYRRFAAASSRAQTDANWDRRCAIGVYLSGIAWGSASLLLFPAQSMVHQAFLAFVLAGMSAGAVTTLSAIFGLSLAFLLLNLLPLTGRFLAAGDEISLVMAIMTALFTLMLTMSSRRLNRTIVESLEIRHQHQQAEDTIQHQALHDALTGLPNRRLLIERLEQEIPRSVRHGHMGAVLFLDLDHFKTINDSLGHRVGDKLLQSVAARLLDRTRREDTVARLGGDEFVLLLTEVADEAGIAASNTQKITDAILDLFHRPFSVEGHELHLSASVGVTLFPMDPSTPEELLQQADVAMYSAKESGRENSRLFVPGMQEAVDQRLRIERGLRQAIGNDELELYYQPQIAEDGRLIGAEALVRWNHPEQGLVSPAEFIGIAEETGLIYQLGDWVLRRACGQLAQLDNEQDLHISVNISPKQFRESRFLERVQRILDDTGAPPHRLTLEITESLFIENIDQTIERMRALRSLGISFAIDDFGTGHSSLAYLKRLPLDTLKIDRSFVIDLISDPNDAMIVETILVMAKHLGLMVVAEGVETEEALAFLKLRGCRMFQGYLFGRPAPFEQLLRQVKAPRLAQSGH
jgi:diguanylate cyclase (GGDEF)-like protein